MEEQSEAAQATESLDPVALFPPDIQHHVTGLMHLGELTEEVIFCGHSFGLRTLKPAHHFAIAQALQPYRNTIQEVNVFQALTVGMSLTDIDGDPNFCPPIGPDPTLEGLAKARLNFITHRDTGWYPPTIDYLWGCYIALENKAQRAINELDRLVKRDLEISSSPLLDPLTVQGLSPDVMRSEILDSMGSNSDS